MEDKAKIIPQLSLEVKTDIPFPEAKLTIYQPSIKEISLIGESDFLIGVSALTRDYKKYQDNSDLSELSNFDILMSVMKEKTDQSKKIIEAICKVLFLIFPNYKIKYTPNAFLFTSENKDLEKQEILMIDKENFDKFQKLIFEMFCLKELSGGTVGDEYNPAGDRARALAEKFRKS